jgi:hypothetical protein
VLFLERQQAAVGSEEQWRRHTADTVTGRTAAAAAAAAADAAADDDATVTILPCATPCAMTEEEAAKAVEAARVA